MTHEFLPAHLRLWVADRAREMGLPGRDDYILLPIRLEKQRLEVEAAHRAQSLNARPYRFPLLDRRVALLL